MKKIPSEISAWHAGDGVATSSTQARVTLLVPFLAGLLCFANTLPNDYCYDDVSVVRDNPRVHEPGQWWHVVSKDHWVEKEAGWQRRDLLYRPVTLASYRLVRMVFGADAFGQHLVNVLLHGVIAALVARLGWLLSGSTPVGVVAGIVFAVLPIHSEAVAAVVGRSDLVCALGVLGAVLLHLRSLESVGAGGAWAWRVGAGFACLVALGGKETGLAAAPMIVLFDALRYPRREFGRSSTFWRWASVRRLVYVVVPVGLYLVVRWYVLGGRLVQEPPETKTINVLTGATTWQHALGVTQLWGTYWGKTLWPAVLTIKYSINGIRLATSVFDGNVLIGLSIALALAAASWYRWRRGDRRVVLLFAAMVVCYLPTSNAFVLMQVFLAERIWYLPSAWVCLIAGLWLGPKMVTPAWRAVFLLAVIAMTVRCLVRNAEWRNNDTLYASAYRDAPDSVGALQLYGGHLARAGRFEEALPLLHQAVEIDLGLTDAYRDLGQAYLAMGDDEKAVRYLQSANMQAPGHPPTESALELAKSRWGAVRTNELNRLRTAADREPNNLRTELDYVAALRNVGRLDDALNRQRQRDERFSDQAKWHHEFAVTLVLRNELDLGIERYRKSLAVESDQVSCLIELAMLLLERRGPDDLSEAERLAAQAGRLAPDSPSVLACRAEVAAGNGNLGLAVALLRRGAANLSADHPMRTPLLQRAKTLGDTRGNE